MKQIGTIVTSLVFFLIIGCTESSTKNGEPSSLPNLQVADTIVSGSVQTKTECEWKVEYIYDSQEKSYYYPYQIRWTCADSIIEYHVDSKSKDTCLPIEYQMLFVKNKEKSVCFNFYKYNSKLPKFTQDYKDLNRKKISAISIYNYTNRSSKTYESSQQLDSLYKILILK